MLPRLAYVATLSVALVSGCSSSSTSDANAPDARVSDARVSDAHVSDAHVSDAHVSDAHVSDANAGSVVGTACVPGDEADPVFQAFSYQAVSLAPGVSACAAGVCLVNHFQGRVTCPYGQTAPGMGPTGPSGSVAAAESSQDGCKTPGASGAPVTATNASVAGFSAGMVPAQITGTGAGDRTANKTVYCSCRCANADGKTDDGASYCTCPGGYACTQLVTAIGSDDDSAGAYCLLAGTKFDPELVDVSDVCTATAVDATDPGYCPAEH